MVKRKHRKFTKAEQSYFLLKLSELLNENFTLSESIQFMQYMLPHKKDALAYILSFLKQGRRFDESLYKLGYSEQIISQIYLGEKSSQFQTVLKNSGYFLETYAKQVKKLKQLLVYPLFLVTFVFVLLLGIRQFFLPQIENILKNNPPNVLVNITVFLIEYFPVILLSMVLCIFVLLAIFYIQFQRKTALNQVVYLCKVPIVKKWIKLYYSYYFSSELSYFFQSGYTTRSIVDSILQGNTSKILKEFAVLLNDYAASGDELSTVILKLPFLNEEMAYIVTYGEKISQVAVKLKFYAEECFDHLQKDIEMKMTYIQPIIFLLIGVIILLVYITLMLPVLTMVDNLLI